MTCPNCGGEMIVHCDVQDDSPLNDGEVWVCANIEQPDCGYKEIRN